MARLQLPSIGRIPGGRGFAALSRRVRTLIIAATLFLILFILALTMPVPYVVLSPGPTYNTLGTDRGGNVIIMIGGTQAKVTSGHLNMTTVSVTNQPLSAFQALTGWLRHDEVVVPRSAVYPPGQSQQQTDQQNTQDFTESQDNAIAAASCELGYPKKFGIVGVQSQGAGHAVLKPADVIETLDGKAADTADLLTSQLAKDPPGTKVSLRLERAGAPKVVTVTLGQPPTGRTGGALGISVGTVCAAPFTVDLGLGNQIGGPSAGLMFALGIMDKVGPLDLTKGRFIAGTGTIDPVGKVGAIGGIQLKMIAAKDNGASVFLAPNGNCEDVRKATPAGLQVVSVDTLHNAVQDLLKIEKGEQVPGC